MTSPLASPQRRRLMLAGTAALLAAPSLRAQGSYPNKPVRVIVPSSPGSSQDLVARRIAIPLAQSLGQPVVVENVAGSGGMIGTAQIVRAPKDGYTIGVISSNFSISPYLYRQPFDPIKDVTPVAILTSGANVLMASPKLEAKNPAELFALAKTRTGDKTLTYASAGVGSTPHLAAAMMEMMAGIDLLHVPYKGLAYQPDLIANQIDMGFMPLPVAVPLVRAGTLRALAVTTSQRVPTLPDVPSFAESGLPGYEFAGWNAVIVGAGTPPAIVQRLNKEVLAALRTPDVIKYAENLGSRLVGGTPEEAARWVARDLDVLGKLAHRIGLKPEN
ncbi:Bug family tripartite tricarboxylate transporter substrate binding protein [Hydrogenophaga sp. BPS33]|uniref:Bug family tripartite tricarboxylate transporter substrate binding protein n=1 Tax=Hydrogenophaga sp. BPS33 TaxID=2651974 RepID=UPI00131FA459|nr:tripartite tricarboxylate transporter substrate-binding protein [Hydrogenophaga sp. BPS33]QHE84568.1 tripartite tricarboxylate transporter substrate binding protein [Hydrogenophaga sp. BPS33]